MSELEALILHVYPWWEMQRVRQMSFMTKKAEKPLCNAWRHTSLLLDHNYRGVTTPNCDTLYSGAWLDLAHGPDSYGALPADVPCVRSQSQVVWLLARYLIGTEDLVATSEALRRAVSLGQLPDNGTQRVSAASPLRTELIPAVRKNPQNFWEIIRTTFNEDPALFKNMAQTSLLNPELGWPASSKMWQDLSADFQQHFPEAYLKTLAAITANNSGNIQTRGQWRYPGPDIGKFGDNAMYRAEVALWGLGALETDEVLYVSTFTDSEGELLNGAHSYRFRIPPEGIPARAFWSLTMYEVDLYGSMYFAANQLKRYAVGDRTQGLRRNSDGSTDIRISHMPPVELDEQANWLPAPEGLFRLMIRAYAPSESFQSGQILPPAVEKWTHR